MPVSLCEWRVRIGTFVHWMRDYEIREKEERLLKERTRRVKVLCERLRAKRGVSEQESGDGSETSDKSKQGDCNSQDPTDPKVRSRCSHGTAIIQSSGNASIQDLLSSCDHCIKDLLTPNDSQIKDVLAPSDTSIKELLTPTDSCVKDSLPSDVCQKDPHTASDSYSEDLMADDCHIHELLNESDSCIKGLLTASDSWEDVPLLSLESCGNERNSPLEPCNRDLLPRHIPDSCDTCSELQVQSGSYVSTLSTPGDSYIQELLLPRDLDTHNLLKQGDSHISKLLTPEDSYKCDLLPSADSYSSELHELKPGSSCLKEFFTPDSTGDEEQFCIDTSITDQQTAAKYCFKEHHTISSSSFMEHVPLTDAAKDQATSPEICTQKQNTLSETVKKGEALPKSCMADLFRLTHSSDVGLLNHQDFLHGSCFSRRVHMWRSKTCYALAGFYLLYLVTILLMRSGDVETNPGPNTVESTISEIEFLKLAQDIYPSYYTHVGVSLGIPYAHLEAILIEKLNNYPSAFMTVFMKWNVKQQPPNTNKREVLADALRESDLVDFSDRLRNGHLMRKSEGEPSKLRESLTTHVPQEFQTKPLFPEMIDSSVSEMEFLKLAQEIKPSESEYIAVGVHLGIPYTLLQAILMQKLLDYPSALMAVFMKWNVMEHPPNTNKREVLADALRENDLSDLSERLRSRRLLPSITGGPSTSPESQTKPPPAESETKPLSPELIARCADNFKCKYRSSLCKIRADPLDPASIVQFEDMYTNLVLQKEYGRGKRALSYNDLLDLKVNGQFPKRLMVQGEGGAGKTTLCAKIAWDWIEGKYFKDFVWVLVVPLRDAQQYTLGEIAKSYLDKNNPTTPCQLVEYIRSNPSKVFIVFDGLDEFSGRVVKKGNESSKSQGHQSHPDDQIELPSSLSGVNSSDVLGSLSQGANIELADILCSVELASCPVLVTSRPWRAAEIRSDRDLNKLYTFIHVEGFSRENLSVYIRKYFAEDNAKANQLIQFMDENHFISENMASYPIYVAMLCLMWRDSDEQRQKKYNSLQTFSQKLKAMIGFLKEHYAQKEIERVVSSSFIAYLKKIDKVLEPVAKQAFMGLLTDSLVFSDEDFHSCPESIETACQVGILSLEKRIRKRIMSGSGRGEIVRSFFFPHRLFQEYMAGVYLASLYESDRNEWNRLIEEVVLPRKEYFRYLLYFTVSQNKSVAKCVLEYMLQDDIQGNEDFIVDVAFESQDSDAAWLVKGKVFPEETSSPRHASLTSHTESGYAFLDEIQPPQNESDSDLESRVFSKLSVPPEILARGPEAIRAYTSALKDGKKKVFRTRLMLVGQEGVGKTSLKKSLTGRRFDPKEELTDGAETEDICEISIEHIELGKDGKISWSVKQKGNADDSVGEFKRVLLDHMVSTLQGNTSQEQASSEVSCEPDSNESDDRHQGEAGAHGEKLPDGVTQDKATTSQFDSKETTGTRMYGDKTVGAESPAVSSLDDERSKMETTETTEAPKIPKETSIKIGGIPDDVADHLEERLKEGAESGNEEGKDKASLNIWDFAGHDVYYTTHQVFLTWRAIYVVVFDLSTDLNSVVPPECQNRSYQKAKQGTKSELTCLQFIEFWLYSIYNHAVMPASNLPKHEEEEEKSQETPPIFIVGTHREEVKGSEREKEEKIAAAFGRIETMIKGKPFECHMITTEYQIENKLEGDMKLDELRKEIENVAKKEPYMGEEIPLRWLKFEEFHATNKKKGKNCMTLDEIKEHTQEIGIESEEELLTMLNFYHDLGSIIYYGDVKETKSLLRDIVILSPQWLINVFKQVITVLEYSKRDGIVSDAWSILEDYGILEDRLIQHMWQKFQEQKDALVELMMKFDLICKAPANWCPYEEAGYEVSDKTAKSPQKSYYVPSRLPPRCQQKDTSEVDMKSSIEFYINFRRFLPEGLFHRLMARAVQWQMDRDEPVRLFYRQICMTVDDEHEALLTMLPPSKAAIKVNVIRAEIIPEEAESVSQTSDPQTPGPKAVKEVRDFATKTLNSMIQQFAKNLRYDLRFICPYSKCSKMHFFKDCFQREFVKCGQHKFLSIGILRKYGYEKEVDALKEKYGPKSAGNPTSSIVKETVERTQKFVTQKQLDTVSRKFPHEKFHNFCYELGVDYNEADSILDECRNNYRKTLMRILMAWKTETGGLYSELVSALTDSEARDLVALIEPGGPTTSSGDDCGSVTRERAHVVATPANRKDTMAGKREAMTEHEVRNVSPEEVSQPAAKKGRRTRVHSSSPDATQRLHGTSPLKQGAQQQPGVEYTYNYSHECAQYEFDKEETQRARMCRSSHHHSAQPCEASMSDYQTFLGTPNPSYRYSQYDQSSSLAGHYSTVYQQSAQGRTDYSSQSWHDQPHHSGQYTSGAYFAHWSQSPQGSESWQPDIYTVQQSARSHHPFVQVIASSGDRSGFSEHPHIPPYHHSATYRAPLPFRQPVMSTGNHPLHQSSATTGGSSNWSTPDTANQIFPPTTFSSPIQNRTYGPSDSHGYNTLGTSNPFSNTYDEGRSRRYKRRAPSTQSRPPEDISEIPEKKPHLL